MNKQEATEYIKAVGHSAETTGYNAETAEYMLKGLPDPFDMEVDEMPDSVYDTIMDGVFEVAYMMKSIVGGEF